MKTILGRDLRAHVGMWLRFYAYGDTKKVHVAKIQSVDKERHSVVLARQSGVDEQDRMEEVEAFYSDESQVEVCDEDEAILLAFRDGKEE